jgi:hypothetical protein
MKKKILAVTLGFALAVSVGACGKKEEQQPIPRAPITEAPAGMPMASPHGTMGPRVEKTVVVPDDVKASWAKVKLAFEDRTTKKSAEYMVKIGSEFNIPNTNLKVAVGEFLPDFTMDGATITSVSNNPNNPVVRIEVFEAGQSIFRGWLFGKFPDVHPFVHDRYGLKLIEGVKG